MERLIDAEKLNTEIGYLINFLEDDTKSKETIGKEELCECIKALRECVDEQPTAYDVEKVVEQLEKNREVFERRNIIPCVNMDYAVRVVRKGGVE